MERAAGIEPASLAWKAKAQPLYHARKNFIIVHSQMIVNDICKY